MRIFVTGASGRVGRALVASLVAGGHEVAGLTRSSQGADALRALGARAVAGSLEDAGALKDGLADAELVYHLAGGLRGPGAMDADRLNNVGTQRLVGAMQDTPGWKRRLSGLVFSSTVAVYGDRSGLWVTESMAPYPQTRYAESKLAAEALLLRLSREVGLPARVVRLAAVYGPDMPFMMADRIRAGRAWLPGEGRNFVPTIHRDDAVAGLIRVAEAGTNGQIYNLADPQPTTLREFYSEVARLVSGTPPRFWSTWVPSYIQYGLADRYERLASRLGRRPAISPDSLRLFVASSRMKVDRLSEELAFTWTFPDFRAGLAASL